jgi:aryl-alcohol dehydrogenase-like predicted oxidoreductase
MGLRNYVTLGRSGLLVSPLSMGTMTFGTDWGWGTEEAVSASLFDAYIGGGGNFIDTANGYTNGTSEKMLGKFMRERGLRDRLVLATKFSFSTDPGDPNAAGNGRKHIYQALENSLRRLQTDYIDLYWLHAWDMVTPVEEVIATFTDLVRAGKIRHYGFSDTPAWYAARAYTLAEKEGKERPIALQLEYSLAERSIEREHVPAAQELGIGICPWSALAAGFLSGKYKREGVSGRGDGRLAKSAPIFERFTERNWRILDVLVDVAKQVQKTPSQVALNWVATQPGTTSTILGATKLAQLEDNVAALEFTIPAELRAKLDEVSALGPAQPYLFFGAKLQEMIHGKASVRAWAAAPTTASAELAPAANPKARGANE